jgi:hypothetical protein
MWISTQAYIADKTNFVTVVAERDAAKQQLVALTNTLQWLQARVTQLEMERAAMVFQQYGVKIPVPVLETAPEMPGGNGGIDSPLNAVPNFNDVGDEEARRQGIGWNDNGELQYHKVK